MILILALAGLTSAAPAAGASSDPFAVEKVTLSSATKAPAAPRLYLRRNRRPTPHVEVRPDTAPLHPGLDLHDDARETSGPVIRTGKGVMHCYGHWFGGPNRK